MKHRRAASGDGARLSVLLLGAALALPASAEVPIRGSLVAEEPWSRPDELRSTFSPLHAPDGPVETKARSAPAPAQHAVAPSGEDLAEALRRIAAEPAAVPRPSAVGRTDLDLVLAAYAARDFRPFWSDAAGWTAAGRSLVDRLSRADEDALEPADYATPAPHGDASQRARADLAASLAAVAYAEHARGGRIDPSRLSKSITPVLDLPAADAVLAALAGADAPGDVLRDFNPPHPGYRALRGKLAEMREATGTLIAEGSDATSPKRAAPSIGDVIANMERWRWMPRDLGARRIEVNIPEYTLRLFDGDRRVHQARVVVGKPKTQTPIFSETMEYVVVNPSWSVPQSILRKEILPKLEADPDYLARHGYRLVRNGERVSVRQAPGERNALGFIKFMFPNTHAVYIHDTPKRKLFAESERAFSYGCVRVDKPFELAEFVLAETGFDRGRLEALIGKGERAIHLARPLPVHIGYFTVVVDETGRLQRFPDIYGHDEKVRTALRQGPNRVASR